MSKYAGYGKFKSGGVLLGSEAGDAGGDKSTQNNQNQSKAGGANTKKSVNFRGSYDNGGNRPGQPASSKQLEKAARAEGLEQQIPESNVGFAMLQKMGYKKGQGLGKEKQGMAEPVPIALDRIEDHKKAGLGREETWVDGVFDPGGKFSASGNRRRRQRPRTPARRAKEARHKQRQMDRKRQAMQGQIEGFKGEFQKKMAEKRLRNSGDQEGGEEYSSTDSEEDSNQGDNNHRNGNNHMQGGGNNRYNNKASGANPNNAPLGNNYRFQNNNRQQNNRNGEFNSNTKQMNHLNLGPGFANERQGDWNCASCGNSNFARRNECYRCKVSRPNDGGGGSGHGGFGAKEGDWDCSSCRVSNFARRTECFKCNTPRPQSGGTNFGNRNNNFGDRNFDNNRPAPPPGDQPPKHVNPDGSFSVSLMTQQKMRSEAKTGANQPNGGTFQAPGASGKTGFPNRNNHANNFRNNNNNNNKGIKQEPPSLLSLEAKNPFDNTGMPNNSQQAPSSSNSMMGHFARTPGQQHGQQQNQHSHKSLNTPNAFGTNYSQPSSQPNVPSLQYNQNQYQQQGYPAAATAPQFPASSYSSLPQLSAQQQSTQQMHQQAGQQPARQPNGQPQSSQAEWDKYYKDLEKYNAQMKAYWGQMAGQPPLPS